MKISVISNIRLILKCHAPIIVVTSKAENTKYILKVSLRLDTINVIKTYFANEFMKVVKVRTIMFITDTLSQGLNFEQVICETIKATVMWAKLKLKSSKGINGYVWMIG